MATLLEQIKESQKSETPADTPSSVSTEESPIAARARALLKASNPDAKVFDFYLSKEEQDTAKLEATSKVMDILDFIDNINRLGYATTGAAHEAVKSLKYENEPVSKTVSDVLEAGWKGFKREDKKFSRDIARLVAPETVKNIEDQTKFKLFGSDALEMDALSIPGLVGDILLDPVTYIPFGAPVKMASTLFTEGKALAKKMAASHIGVEGVEKISKSAKDVYIKTVAPLFNQKAIWKEYGVEDLFETLKTSKDAAETLAAKKAVSLSTLGEKKGIFGRVNQMVDENGSIAIHEAMQKMADEAEQIFGNLWAKELGISSQGLSELKDLNSLLDGIKYAERPADRQALIQKLNKAMLDKKIDASQYIKNGLLEDQGIKKFVRKIALAERDATLEFAKQDVAISRKLRDESVGRITDEINEIQKALKGGVKLSHSLVKKDIDTASQVLKNLDDTFSKMIKGNLTDETVLSMRGHMEVLKNRLSFLDKYAVKETATKSAENLKKIGEQVHLLDAELARLQYGAASDIARAEGAVRSKIKDIAKNLSYFKKARQSEILSLKQSSIEGQKASMELLNGYKSQLDSLMKNKYEIERQYAKDLARANVAFRKADKMAFSQAKKYHDAFQAINSGKAYQRFLQKNAAVKQQIFEKGLQGLPKELQEPTRKLRQLYDEYALKGMQGDDPFLRGTNPLYAPRAISEDFITEATNRIEQFRSGNSGFLKRRKFERYDEFKEWVEKNGGKVDNDAMIIAFKYMKDFEMNYARYNVEKSLLERLGVEKIRDLPPEIQRSLQYIYKDGYREIDNPIAAMAYKNYAKALNKTKMALTIINPAFHGRNILGFPFLAATTAGMKHGLNPFNYSDAILIKLGKEGSVVAKGGRKWTFQEIRDAAEKSGYFGSSLTRGDMKSSAKLLLGRYSWKKDPIKRAMGEVFKFSMHTEDMGRYGALVAALKAGNDMPKAVELAKKAMFDYNLINSPADKALQGIFGFYSFSRKNLPRQFMTLLNDPKQYEILSRVIDKVSNREQLTDEELDLMSGFERETFKIFGEAVDGIRTFTTLGFFPVEESYQTLNAITHFDKSQLAGRANPLLTSFLDYYYGKDSFYGSDFGNYLPSRYVTVIPETLQKVLGLEKRVKPKYRGGEIVGQEEVLYGDTDTIFMIRKFPLTSRFFGDIANALETAGEGKKAQAISAYTLGIKERKIDLEARRSGRERDIKEKMTEKAKAKGAATYESIYVPSWQKNDQGTPAALKRELKRKREALKRNR